MKKILLSTAIVAAILILLCAGTAMTGGQAAAQPPMTPGAQGPLPNVALVDVNYIFKRHVRLKAQLEELGKDGAAVQKGFEDESRKMQQEAEKLKIYKIGSPEYTQLEEYLVNKKSVLQGQMALKRKEFVQREAKLYYNAYLEISRETQSVCEQRGIAMAMNFNGDAIDPDQPETVARGISNRVIYFNKSLDITPYVLARFAPRPETANRDVSPQGVVFPQR